MEGVSLSSETDKLTSAFEDRRFQSSGGNEVADDGRGGTVLTGVVFVDVEAGAGSAPATVFVNTSSCG